MARLTSCPHCNHTWEPRKRTYSQFHANTGTDNEPIYCPKCKKDRKRIYNEAGKAVGWK